MRPTLITVRGVRIPSYPAMFYMGVLLGILAQNAAANAAALPTARVYAATFVLLPVALVGARLLHVAGHWRDYEDDRRQIVDRASGGIALYGGLLVMLPASLAVLPALDVPYWRFWDVTTFPILVAMVWTRVGCLLNGCCAGRASTGRLHDGLHRVPTQLLEAAVAAVLLAAAVVAMPLLNRPGELFLLLLGGYGACRMLLQPQRGERSDEMLLLSAALVALSLTGLVLMGT